MSSALRALILSATLMVLAFADARAADQSSNGSSSAAERLQEVTVTAERQRLMPRVRKFVNQIVAPENGGVDGIARWQAPPVCPLVSGLTRQHGEFILERLSEIARKAGVPLGEEHCTANLYVLVTSQPGDLLRAMEKRNRPFTFGYDTWGDSISNSSETPKGVVDDFIETPRAVRVWYNANQKDPWGGPLATCQSMLTMPVCAKPERNNIMMCQPGVYFRCGRGTAGGSHLALSARSTFSRVFVIVDRTRVRGVTFGQLAAYVAMVGLAKLKPDADLRDAPTILKLFDRAPRAAPAGLTDWDQAFLKSLYATDTLAKGQSGQIARAMVRDIAH
ncbi:MAG: hypothetical protein ACREUT_13950 [Steroidobacteraceae bacterium]